VKLLVDQMWPAVLAEQLGRRGHDVIAVLEREDLLHRAALQLPESLLRHHTERSEGWWTKRTKRAGVGTLWSGS
jgi:hypothetical protein